MAPPKKNDDAFANLFQSASKGTTTPSMVDTQMKNMSLSERQRMMTNGMSQSNSIHSSYTNLAHLSASSSRGGTPVPAAQQQQSQQAPLSQSFQIPTPTSKNSSSHSLLASQKDDPFAIFYNNPTSSEPTIKPINRSQPVPTAPTGNTTFNNGEISLLDDEFTDAFQAIPEPSIVQRPASANPVQSKPLHNSLKEPPIERPSSTSSSVRRAKNEATSNRDNIVAELIDIGFSIEMANEAIDSVGLDLQLCVNHIMNKSSGKSTPGGSSRSRTPAEFNDSTILGTRPEGIRLNEISNGLFKSANKLINMSKRTVLKNLEQFHGVATSSSNAGPNVPQWMKNQEKYKAEAIERKYGGEDYGSDEENINQEEIDRIMRLQKEKAKERNRERLENRSSPDPNRASREPPQPSREHPPVPRPRARATLLAGIHDSSRQTYKPKPRVDTPPHESGRNGNQNYSSREGSVESASDNKPASSTQPSTPAPEVDLLGLSDTTSTYSTHAKQQSSLRDRSPLNQFDETDYTIAKDKATEAYKSGDYTTALDNYNICLGKLSPNHEFRVIILSNLALVYKLSGHLKESLQSVEEALKLIDESEIPNSQVIIVEKPAKYWYTKLIMVKAEVLELLERFEASLDNYQILIKKLGCTDKKVMDGKRRVDKIVNPQSHKPAKASPRPSATPTPRASTPIQKPRQQQQQQQPNNEEVDVLIRDQIDNRIQQWAASKQNNLRAMLTNLDEIIPGKIAMKESLRKLTLNDLMLPKQVKIQYLRVISYIHPDKLASQCKGDKETELMCNGVFIILNKRWEAFRQEESI